MRSRIGGGVKGGREGGRPGREAGGGGGYYSSAATARVSAAFAPGEHKGTFIISERCPRGVRRAALPW